MITPIIPPATLISIASDKNLGNDIGFFAPIASLVPISLVLSITEANMIFIIPIPPTSRDIPAIAPNTILNMSLRSLCCCLK